ncbi:K(+)/H(+) antiporter [Batrachochytrium dendrobatidis]
MTEGGSFLGGSNPLSDSLALFLLQVVIIICMSRLVAIPLQYLRQPIVIAEVIGGIILGPSVLCRFQSFKDNVFPKSSLPILNIVANFGLVLFLFLVGLELDPTKLISQFKKSAAISLAGIALPFAAGVGVSKILYDRYADPSVKFSSFFVFCGVAMSITAFPVLARILTERKLLRTDVGQATLAAAASDDAMAWCLLALVVALIHNPSNSIIALYVFLTVVAWAIFLWIAIRPILLYLVRRSETKESVSQSAVLATFVLVCISAWFTQAVGVHAIFGAFLVGIITPHEHGFAIKITEKVEDLISILFLPLYFAYSGLNFSIDSLNDGASWGMVFFVIFVACGGKIIGCTTAAKFAGMSWRESITVGFLMNTKGLVELIVLNLGLQAGVINTQIFTIFVIMALVTTFMTVPIVSVIYPMSLYQNVNGTGGTYSEKTRHDKLKSENAMGKGAIQNLHVLCDIPTTGQNSRATVKILVCLTGMRTVPAMMNLTQMIAQSSTNLSVYALRLVELTSRMSKVMMATESSETLRADPVVNVFRTFGQLNKVGVRTLLAVTEPENYAQNVVDAAEESSVNLIIYPVQTSRSTGQGSGYPRGKAGLTMARIFRDASCSVALFIDRGFGVSSAENMTESGERSALITSPATSIAYPGSNQRIFMVFYGGADDCEAARLAGLLAKHPGVTLSVLVISFSNGLYNQNYSSSSVWGSMATVNVDRQPTVPAMGAGFQTPVVVKVESGGVVSTTSLSPPVDTTLASHRRSSIVTTTGAVENTVQNANEEETILAALATIPGATIQRRQMDDDPLETVMAEADTYGPKDMIIIGRGQYADSSEWQSSSSPPSVANGGPNTTIGTGQGSADSNNTPPSLMYSGARAQSFRYWLDHSCISSVMVVQKKLACNAQDNAQVV